MTMYNDYPFDEVTTKAGQLARQGLYCYQKFTCDKCGQRLTMDVPNTFYTSGKCDKCGHTTDIRAKGCNYLLTTQTIKTASGQ